MNKLFESIYSDDGVEQMFEANWKQAVGTGLVAASLLTGMPQQAAAKQSVSITQEEKGINIENLLHAFKQVESSGGRDTRTRYEAGIEKQLRRDYAKLHTRTKKAIDTYGYKAMATSYGPYQMIGATAYDMGHTGTLEDLKTESVCKEMARKYIIWLMNRAKTTNVKDVISGYNAGIGGIGSNPAYINKVLKHYTDGGS